MTDVSARLWVQDCPHCTAQCRLDWGELRCVVCGTRLDWGTDD